MRGDRDNYLHVDARPSASEYLARVMEGLRQRYGFGRRPAVEEEPVKAPKSPATLRRRAANKAARRARRVHRVRAAR